MIRDLLGREVLPRHIVAVTQSRSSFGIRICRVRVVSERSVAVDALMNAERYLSGAEAMPSFSWWMIRNPGRNLLLQDWDSLPARIREAFRLLDLDPDRNP